MGPLEPFTNIQGLLGVLGDANADTLQASQVRQGHEKCDQKWLESWSLILVGGGGMTRFIPDNGCSSQFQSQAEDRAEPPADLHWTHHVTGG